MIATVRQVRRAAPTASVLLALVASSFFALGCADGDASDSSSGKAKSDRDGSEPISVMSRVDEQQVEIGDRVTFTVEVRMRDDVEVELPSVVALFADRLLHDAGFWRDAEPIGTRSVKLNEVVLDPGIGPLLELPPVTVKWRWRGDDDWNTATTEAITVEVASVSADDLEFREPADGFDLPEPEQEIAARDATWIFAALAGAAVLLAGLFVVLFRQKKKRAVPPPPADAVAEAEFARLEAMGLIESGRAREFYYRLTAILRRYIEDRFDIRAPELTTEEFLDEARSAEHLEAAERDVLERFLYAADMVKYAGREPSADDARAALITAREFVARTRSVDSTTPSSAKEVGVAV